MAIPMMIDPMMVRSMMIFSMEKAFRILCIQYCHMISTHSTLQSRITCQPCNCRSPTVGDPLDAVVAGHKHIELAGENQQSPKHLQLGID
jgi:hypothetical protein